jgi:hypothetical protein
VLGLTGINQDQFQRDGVRIPIRVADGDLNSAAAIDIDQASEIVVRLDREGTSVGGADVYCLGTSVSLAGSSGRAHVRGFEEPINAIEGDQQRIRAGAEYRRIREIDGSGSDQLSVELLLWPENDPGISLTGRPLRVVHGFGGIAPRGRAAAWQDTHGALVRRT